MKTLFTTLTVILLAAATALAGPQPKGTVAVTGRTCGENKERIDYATVVLISRLDSTKMHGIVSDSAGRFSLNVPRGDYRLRVAFIGYETYDQLLSLNDDTALGDIALKTSAVKLDEVVVRGQFITHDADRFTVNVGNSPLAIGKTADEMLALAPGVWVKDGISINGRSDTRVMMNNRLLRETGEDLVAYLNTIKAEDILKIEVIPSAGADYDADMAGGVIKITLKRQRNDGLDGSVSMRFEHSTQNRANASSPSVNLNYRSNKLSLYSTLYYQNQDTYLHNTESSIFHNSDNKMISEGTLTEAADYRQARLGAIYDITPKQNFGVEAEISRYTEDGLTLNELMRRENGNLTNVSSRYTSKLRDDRISLTGNYILTMDTLGSVFKLVADYNKRIGDQAQGNMSSYRGFQNFDTVYRNFIDNRNMSTSADASFEIKLGKASTLRTGAKYTYNKMDNGTLYEYERGRQWNRIDPLTNTNEYGENIGALYASYATKLENGIGFGAGLRTEYTYAVPSTSSTVIKDKQQYWGFFPNANVSVPLNEKKSHILTFIYSRKIRRPSFWQLNPYRMPLSEYSFIEGNPRLQPSYRQDFSLRWLFAQKYSLTAMMDMTDNSINQVAIREADNVIVYRYENISKIRTYSLALNIPTNLTPWWYMNLYARGGRMYTKTADKEIFLNALQANISNTFTIAKKYYLDVQGFYLSGMTEGNLEFKSMWQVNSSLKRSFAKNKFTASVFINDIFNSRKQNAIASETTFYRKIFIQEAWRTVGISFRYNFKAGKNVKVKQIESGSEDDKSRL